LSFSTDRARLRLAVNMLAGPLLQFGPGAADLWKSASSVASSGTVVDRATRGAVELEIAGGRRPVGVEHRAVRVLFDPGQVARDVIDESAPFCRNAEIVVVMRLDCMLARCPTGPDVDDALGAALTTIVGGAPARGPGQPGSAVRSGEPDYLTPSQIVKT
jgi:hypothetical protein